MLIFYVGEQFIASNYRKKERGILEILGGLEFKVGTNGGFYPTLDILCCNFVLDNWLWGEGISPDEL